MAGPEAARFVTVCAGEACRLANDAERLSYLERRERWSIGLSELAGTARLLPGVRKAIRSRDRAALSWLRVAFERATRSGSFSTPSSGTP